MTRVAIPVNGGAMRSAIWALDHLVDETTGEAILETKPVEIPPSDRLPTFRELVTLDAGKAWDELTPAQQREIGLLALRFGAIGQCSGFFHETLADVQSSLETNHWSPEVQATAVWPRVHIEVLEDMAQASFQALCDHFDPMLPQLFGWLERKW